MLLISSYFIAGLNMRFKLKNIKFKPAILLKKIYWIFKQRSIELKHSSLKHELHVNAYLIFDFV